MRALSSRRAKLAAGATALLTLGWSAFATVSVLDRSRAEAQQLAAKDAEIAAMRAQVVAMQREVGQLRAGVTETAARLEARQTYLAAILSGKADPGALAVGLPRAELASADLPAGATSIMAPFAKLETAQLAFVEEATVAAEARYRDTTALIRKLGLSTDRFVRVTNIAMGGPLEEQGEAAEDPAEPKFRDLYLSWQRLDQVEDAIAAVPARVPVKRFTYTSSFGVRYDPFNGATAMHAGVDMAGPVGEPILASAAGRVVKAGWSGGYGNMIEIDHGRGLTTRYGHLSRVQVRPGDRLQAGEQIGRMGSTGRSTGSHLHFEVRVDGRAVDPMPYLRAAPEIAAIQDRAAEEAQGGPAGNGG